MKDLKGEFHARAEKPDERKTEGFRGGVENILDRSAIVRDQKHEIVIRCKDLDEVFSKAETCAVLGEQLKLLVVLEALISSLRKEYATIRQSAETVRKQGSLSLREQISLKRCFKCLICGHLARAWTSAVGRSDRCERCVARQHGEDLKFMQMERRAWTTVILSEAPSVLNIKGH